MLEIEELERMADAKAKALENEISILREKAKSLRVFLGPEREELKFDQHTRALPRGTL